MTQQDKQKIKQRVKEYEINLFLFEKGEGIPHISCNPCNLSSLKLLFLSSLPYVKIQFYSFMTTK